LDALKGEVEWDRNLSKLLKMRIEKGVNLMKKSIENSDELNKRRMEFFKLNTSSIAEERYLCTICSKVTKITLNL